MSDPSDIVETFQVVYIGKVFPTKTGYVHSFMRMDNEEKLGFGKSQKGAFVGALFELHRLTNDRWRFGDYKGALEDPRVPEWQMEDRQIAVADRLRRQRERDRKDTKDLMGELTLDDVRKNLRKQVSGLNRTGYIATVIDFITEGRG